MQRVANGMMHNIFLWEYSLTCQMANQTDGVSVMTSVISKTVETENASASVKTN